MNVVDHAYSPDLWHRRFGHISQKSLEVLSKGKHLSNLKNTHLNLCTYFFCRQAAYNLVYKEGHIIKEDLCVEVDSHRHVRSYGVQAFNKPWYFVNFIDDCSRKLWVYMIMSKDQVLDYFQNFHVAVERETGLLLKAVYYDNGDEYTGLFEEYCIKHAI